MGCVGDHIMNSVSVEIQNPQNCLTTPNKNLGGEGASDRQTPAPESLYKSIFLDNAIIIALYQSYLSMGSR
jgi:hypothetical protein